MKNLLVEVDAASLKAGIPDTASMPRSRELKKSSLGFSVPS